MLNACKANLNKIILTIFQEKQIAFKIFELGLKRFGHEPDYLLAYIDYMSHLNGKSSEDLIKFTKWHSYLS